MAEWWNDLIQGLRTAQYSAPPEHPVHPTICDEAANTLVSLIAKVAVLNCPEAAGFEGPDTYSDCGECVVCHCKKTVEEWKP